MDTDLDMGASGVETVGASGEGSAFDAAVMPPLELRLSTRGLPAAQQFPVWREAMADASLPLTLEIERPGEPFEAEVLMRQFGALQLSSTLTRTSRRNPVVFSRGAAEIARTAEPAWILSYRVVEANTFDYANRREVPFAAGSWCLFSSDDRLKASAHHKHARQIMVRIPEAQVAALGPSASRVLGVPQAPDSLASALLVGQLEILANGPAPTAVESAAIGAQWLELLALALDHNAKPIDTPASGLREGMRRAIEREIARHFTDPAFSPAQAAARVGISTRQLHKVLEPTGCTFARRVQEERLAHARRLLREPGGARRTILDIALDCGFATAEHFSHCFRATFGLSPRDYRDGRRTTG